MKAAQQLAAALSAPDQISKDLLAAARYTERRAPKEMSHTPTLSLLHCVGVSLGLPVGGDAINRYHACATRLYAAIGTDLADFTKDEAIDLLVAAAFWEIEP